MRKILWACTTTLILALFCIVSTKAVSPQPEINRSIKSGDYIRFGTYNNAPILWRVINIDENNRLLLWSEQIITLKALDSTMNTEDNRGDSERFRVGSNLWEKSTLREWLNSDSNIINFSHTPPDKTHLWMGHNAYASEAGFLTNFSTDQKSLISTVQHKSILAGCDSALKSGGSEEFILKASRIPSNSVSNYDNSYFSMVSDKVFLLDIKELSDYAGKQKFSLKKFPTKEAVAASEFKSDYLSYDKTFSYWIRTPVGNTSSGVLRMSPENVISEVALDNRNLGIVPALYISPYFYILSGDGSIYKPYTVGLESNGYKIPEKTSPQTEASANNDIAEDTTVLDKISLNTPSDWSVAGINNLKSKNLLNSEFFMAYKKNISRKEFAYLGVKLYEYITGKSLDGVYVNLNNIYSDTNDEYVRKAFYIGIMNGLGTTYFGANEPITREQTMVLLVRLISRAGCDLNYDKNSSTPFTDENKISDWAKESVRKAYFNKIVNGVAPLKIAPKNKLTKEQALIISYNILNNIQNFKSQNTSSIAKPILKWAFGGTYDTWCEEAYYSSPAVADLNKDGNLEIIASGYSIVNIDAKTGKLNSRIASGHDITEPNAKYEGRTWPNIIIKDIDGDGLQEIITAHQKGYISVYSANGTFKKGWPKKPIDDEFRGLKVVDLDLDGKMEIIATSGRGSGQNTWVYNCYGELRKGWPQLDTSHDAVARLNSGLDPAPKETSFAWGTFNNTLSTGDINNDGYREIIVPSDVPFICAYDKDGNLLNTNSIYRGRKWGEIGFWESINTENSLVNEGWGLDVNNDSPKEERNTVNFAIAGSTVADMDNDGKNEIIVTGNVYDKLVGHPPALYMTPFILNADRTRFKNNSFNWEESPKDTGRPLVENYGLIELCMPNPVVTDIDGDNLKEILYSSFDGKVHCFSLDKTEKNNWPYSVYTPSNPDRNTFEFASVPKVLDINGDNHPEIIFSTWTEKEPDISGKTYNGKVIILNYKGELVWETDLPFALGTTISNGCAAEPMIYDIDNDGEYEIVLNTTYSGVVAYDLQGSKVK